MKEFNGYNLINYKKEFFLNALIFFNIIYSCSFITIGKYPYLKQLNGKNYILISELGISFLDPTLTFAFNEINFEENAYPGSDFYIVSSTSAVQFSKEDDSLILALINANLYVFDSNETLLNNKTIISDYNTEERAKKPYYLFPFKKVENTYITIMMSIIDYDNDFVVMTHQNIIYNKDNNEIFLSEKSNYTLENTPDDLFLSEIRSSI